MRDWIYKLWARLLTIFGDLGCAFTPPRIKAADIRKCLSHIRPGDIVCRRYVWYLDSYCIPGRYTHSGVYVGGSMIVHAIAEGVVEHDIIDFIKDADGFVVLRPKVGPVASRDGVEWAKNTIGRPYDFVFDKKDHSAFYCHELTAEYCLWMGVKVNRDGRYYYADDLIEQCNLVMEV